MFYDRDSAFLVSMPFSNSQMPNGGHLGRNPSWNPPAQFLFYIHFTLYLAFQNSATRTVISFAWSIQLFCDITYLYFVIFKSQIVIKNEIKFLIQNFVFLPYTNSKTL